jgi:hypothetical protein
MASGLEVNIQVTRIDATTCGRENAVLMRTSKASGQLNRRFSMREEELATLNEIIQLQQRSISSKR